MGWSLQKPARRAAERNLETIERWVKETWPAVKGALAKGAWIVFEDETGLSLIPNVRRTWAPRGKTPILTHPYNWKSASMAGVLAYKPPVRDPSIVRSRSP